MHLQQSAIDSFQQEILHWYHLHQRDLPWRQDRDPYHILVSEVMLQQTQVQRVIPKYEAWLKAFPSLEYVAKASQRDVLLHWSGLGYNRRALFLQRFAKDVVEKFGGTIPQDEKVLRELPGIGEYTCKALLCFAFDKQVAVVDTNIRKVITVKFFQGKLPDEKVIQEIAQALLPNGKAYEWNQALMDYARKMLKEHKIPIPKQSKFQGSDRFFRGLILRILLVTHKMHYAHFVKEIEKIKAIDGRRLQTIIEKMENEGLLKQENTFISLL